MSINREQLERQLAEIAQRRQIAQQLSQPRERTQVAGGMVVPYSAGEGLAALGQAWMGRRANKKLDEREATARKGYETALKSAQDEYAGSVPEDQVPGEIIKRVMSTPPDQLMEPVTSRRDATRKLADVALGPSGAAEVTLAREAAQNAPYTLGAGQQRRGAGNEVLADNPAATTGGNSRYGNPQIGPNGNILVLDRSSGEYIDTGKTASANLRLITLPDGSVQAVDMRQPVTGGNAPQTASVVSPETALAGAGAMATAKEVGTTTGENITGLPDALADIDKMRKDIDSLTSDPGFETIYGLSGAVDPRNRVPGTNAANAQAKRQTLSAEAFGVVVQKMRGLGALSNSEGLKVTDAFSRATNPNLSDTEARVAWDEVKLYLDAAETRSRLKAGQTTTQAQPQQPPQSPQPGAMPTFATEQEAEAAAASGQLQPGTRVKIGNATGVWQ